MIEELHFVTPAYLGKENLMPNLISLDKYGGPRGTRALGDVDATRTAIYDSALNAAKTLEPVSNQKYILSLTDPAYDGPEGYSKADEKAAILQGKSLGRRLRGTWNLHTNEPEPKLVDQRRATLASIPHITPRGTFILGGNEYSLSHQMRLRPGIFTRVKESGELESHVNVAKGRGHRYFLDPESGIFRIQVGQARMPLMPVLRALGAKDSDIREAWGNELFHDNATKTEPGVIKKLFKKFSNKPVPEDENDLHKAIKDAFSEMELDPEVTHRTLGKPFKKVTPEVILAATSKLLRVHRREDEPDDRDAMAFQRTLGPEELISERISKGAPAVRRALWKATLPGNLQRMTPGVLETPVRDAILKSGLGNPLEEINPAELYDQRVRVTRMGEGGIPSADSVPDEARSVQPSHYGFIDPVHTPESGKIGIDTRMAFRTLKGHDGRLYSRFINTKTGRPEWRSPQDLADAVVAFPGEMESGERFVRGQNKGKLQYVDRNKVDYQLAHMTEAFGPLASMVPLKQNAFAQRISMGSRMITQALPLVGAEAPLVQSGIPGTSESFESALGTEMGAARAPMAGHVLAVAPDYIKIRGNDRRVHFVDLYNNFPHNRKTFTHNTPIVKPGDHVEEDQLLAPSNFTDKNGVTALGKNLRVGYMAYKGYNFEDAIVMSEAAAKKMASEHMYQHSLDLDDATKASKNAYVSIFPSNYDTKALEKYDKDGVIRPGEKVSMDDPLVLAVRERQTGPRLGRRKASWSDASIKWEHHSEGTVTDVHKGKDGVHVVVKAVNPTQVGDKFAGRYGDKGVVAHIIPDDEMPRTADGQPLEVLLNPLGIISRGNPSQILEAQLGKIAKRTGQPYRLPDFDNIKDMREYVEQELQKQGLSSTEDVIDPITNRTVPGIATGHRFIMKLHHTAEAKLQGRAAGGGASYTAEDTPAKGGAAGSKRIGMLELGALLSHGAYQSIRDASIIRGQKNEEYWRQLMSGFTPGTPKVPFVYQKFLAQLQAAGINPIKSGTKTNVVPMTNRAAALLTGNRAIQNKETVDWRVDRLSPKKGGLFDESITGGHTGNRWSHIPLHEPVPNPIMEEPIRHILGLTEAQFDDVIAGRQSVPGHENMTGPKGLAEALQNINLDKEIEKARNEMKGSKATYRDKAIRRIAYLKAAKNAGQHPSDWVMDRVPVIPPIFRPVSVLGASKQPYTSDANYLYGEVWDANENLKQLSGKTADLGDERLALYNAFKGVTGLGDPIKPENKEQDIKGILQHIFGTAPKFGVVQRKLLGSTVDLVGRGTITPNPNLDMDHVGLPIDKAWTLYKPFVVRRLVRRGLGKIKAMEEVKDQTPSALRELQAEMQSRPVVINRAPVLHRYGVMAFWPVLTKSNTLEIPPLIVGGFGADFDGDAMQFHVPASDEAVKEAQKKMLPSSNLLNVQRFDTNYAPTMEYVGGLWAASTKEDGKPVRVFHSSREAVAAYRRGDISAGQKIEIVG